MNVRHFKRECTINEICLGISFRNIAFTLEILLKKHKIALLKNLHLPTKKIELLSFYARIKTKTFLESLKNFLQNVRNIFPFSFLFSIDLRF